jgi:hypothetical protein
MGMDGLAVVVLKKERCLKATNWLHLGDFPMISAKSHRRD